MKKSFVFSMLCAIIVFVCSFAVLCPNVCRAQYVSSGKPVSKILPSQGKVITLGSIDETGKITVSNGTPCVVEFPVSGSNIRCVEVRFTKSYNDTVDMQFENTIDGSFKDRGAVYTSVQKGDKTACVGLSGEGYTAVRIWFNVDCAIDSICVYDSSPVDTIVPIKNSIFRYLATSIITLLVFVGAFLADKKFGLLDRLCAVVKSKYNRICFFVIGSGTAVSLGILTEVIYRLIVGADSVGSGFNKASCITFCVIYTTIFILFFERKNIAQKPEKTVFFIILIMGVYIILTQPFSHNSWDIDSHYPWALENSFFGTAHYTGADAGIKNNTLFSTVKTLEESNFGIESLNLADKYTIYSVPAASGLAQKASGIFIAVARLFGANFYTKYLAGEVANLLVYASVCYFAIKRLKTGKMIVSIIALFPTNIFLAANYSYDYWTTAFCLLGTAYFVSEMEQPDKPITIWETIVMCGAFAIAALPKLIYILLLALPIFMRKNWVDKKARYTYLAILAAIFIAVFVKFFIVSLLHATSEGDWRGGEVGPGEQIAYILGNPLKYAKILINFLKGYLSIAGTQGYISFFAYLGYGKTYKVFLLLLAFAIVTDKGQNNSFKGSVLIRILALLMFVGMSALIATALYITFTPVALQTIKGCQPRYIIPLLAPLALTIANPGLQIFKNKAIYNTIILIVASVSVLYDICCVVAIPMM